MKRRAYLILIVLGFLSSPLWAQPSINSATMTLIDNDGNGFANIGDEIEISVVVDDAVMGTSVRIFNNNFFPGAGPYSLHKITPGFGDGIEYALTLPIAPGTTHDNVTPESVQFVAQVRLGGVTQDDIVGLTISGVSETIDNVRPSVSNAIFSGSSSTLIVGDFFDVGIDASDGGSIAAVHADLRRLGLDESVPVPFMSGNTYFLESGQVQEASSGDQASLGENRSIVFTVSDLAGNTATYNSASDGQVRMVSNVTPAPAEVVAVQRATHYSNDQDLFDIVITNGPGPVDASGDPMVDGSGQPITYADVMNSGQYEVYWSASGEPFQLLTISSYNNNGVLVQLNLPFTEYAEGKLLSFQVVPNTSGGLTGASESDDVLIQRGVVEAEVFFPADGFVVGNGPAAELSELRARQVEGLEGYQTTGSFRVYFRDNSNPGFQEWMEMVEQPDGTYLNVSSVNADTFLGSGIGPSMSVVARPIFRINGVQLRVLTPAVTYQNNPVLTFYVDPNWVDQTFFHDRFEQQ
jgi:hypothetical protein